jgi:mannose-1-phosphate guanylyltransferase/phosphomannomutase
MTAALIMAGGRSSRMRASLGKQHKALVKVLGVSMLERNILTLLSHDVREIFLAVGASERSVLAYARGRGQRVARAGGAELKLYIEKHPRGSIGAARAIRTAFDDLLVVNVDNLTSLDLTALVEHHRATKAVLTIATHIEPFQVPFGQVSIKDGEIVDYWEKPVLPVPLCSGTYVLGKIARLNIPLNRPSGAPELVHILLRAKHKVSAFPHSSHWIDVNDAASVKKAEELLMGNFHAFELWRQPTAIETVTLCVLNKRRVALLRSRWDRASGMPKLPLVNLIPQNDTPLRSAYRLRSQMGLPQVGKPHLLASCDELDTRNARRTRHHIFVAELAPARVRAPKHSEISWVLVSDLAAGHPRIHSSSRTIAYLQRYVASQNSHSIGYRRPPLRRG